MKVETFVEQGLRKSFLAWLRDGLSTHPMGSSSAFVSYSSSKTDISQFIFSWGKACSGLSKYVFLTTLGFSVPKT